MIRYEPHETVSHVLTPEGAQIALRGSHEALVWTALGVKEVGSPITPAQLKEIVGEEAAKVGQGRAFKNGWIAKHGNGLIKVVRVNGTPDSTIALMLVTSWFLRYRL